jgi:hypothetical protein
MKIIRKKPTKKQAKRPTKRQTKKYKKGGKINLSIPSSIISKLQIEIPNSEIEFAKSKLTENMEYCGKYVSDTDITSVISGAKCILKRDHITLGPIITDGRGSCVHKEKDLYSIIWHTHPNKSKFYPSVEDILTTKKLRRGGVNIKLSVIYTSIGVWLIEALDNDVSEQQRKIMSDKNDQLYWNCFKGKNTTTGFDLKVVVDYINNVYNDGMYQDCKMNILFVPYLDGQVINATIDNVRADSLTP